MHSKRRWQSYNASAAWAHTTPSNDTEPIDCSGSRMWVTIRSICTFATWNRAGALLANSHWDWDGPDMGDAGLRQGIGLYRTSVPR